MKKFLIILFIIVIFLFNYRIISFDNKLRVVNLFEDTKDIKEVINKSNDKIYYYQRTFSSNYLLVINTFDSIVIKEVSLAEVISLNNWYLENTTNSFIKVEPISLSIYLISIVVVLFFPFKKKKTSNK